MKLTKSDREAFVRAVMHDVPSVDYKGQIEQKINAVLFEKAPEQVKWLYKNQPRWLAHSAIWLPNSGTTIHTKLADPVTRISDNYPELWAEIEKLDAKIGEQRETWRKLENKLSATIRTCNTLKQARERLPEFLKYLPQDRDGFGTPNLPAVANVVAELTKAGWPKGEA